MTAFAPTALRTVRILLLAAAACGPPLLASDELVLTQSGDLPIVISAPHGGTMPIVDVPERKGEGLAKGPSGFFTGRDGGTQELALELARQLQERFAAKPSYVISRVHRRYVDFNRPADIAVEDARAGIVYDEYHNALKNHCRLVRNHHPRGLLVDIHGQGTSAETVYRGTKNGLTTTLLTKDFGTDALTGDQSLFGLLKQRGWTVHPFPFNGREQSGFSGGYIVQTYGSHRGDGLDAFQLEFGSRYRTASARAETAKVLVDAIESYAARYLEIRPAAERREP